MAKLLKKKNGGFTLIELMIVVVIIGILAATAIPAFVRFVRRSKTTETGIQLKALYEGAAAYYALESTNRGFVATNSFLTNCLVANAATDNTLNGQRQRYAAINQSFRALNWGPADGLYYRYSIVGTVGTCNVTAPAAAVLATQTYVASGNLDGDAVTSTFEMAAGVHFENGFGHSPVFYVQGSELE